MQATIRQELDRIAQDEHVVICYACESGSRAWGFPSADSDYDVRFLYVRPRDWYLSIDVERRRDVIERPLTDELDVSGWDLRKALYLLGQANTTLLEWLDSPIVYREATRIPDWLRELAPTYYAPRSSFHHYLSIAGGHFKRNVKGDQVKHKAYFYVLRPLLACRWIETCSGPAPMAFEPLFRATVDAPALIEAVEALLVRKRQSQEMDYGPGIPVIDAFIAEELKRLEGVAASLPKPPVDRAPLNELFRRAIREAWADE
jgi:predicted nucleotidyltransferase